MHNYFTWIQVGGLHVPAGLLVDPLSITMCLFVTGISALIHLYSIGYMKGDQDYPKFFLYLNLFVFSMLLLVLANNLLLTFVGWEGVGVCSYWLVCYWFDRDSAASAGKKAFIYNRVGDVGFLIAMFLIFSQTGTLSTRRLAAGSSGSCTTSAAAGAPRWCCLLFLAATGKWAQIPLFNWLPDAMEGPTPVSALIHAATMVTAGVYLLVPHVPGPRAVARRDGGHRHHRRRHRLRRGDHRHAQKDIKKVLAFSTVSQIGYMVLAVGSGPTSPPSSSWSPTRSSRPCSSSAPARSSTRSTASRTSSGWAGCASTCRGPRVTFLVGWLAIAGIPPFAGFWSKGDVLDNVYAHNKPLWALGVLTAILTAYYMTRLFVLAFGGEPRWDRRPAR